jgi:hypothetical protein
MTRVLVALAILGVGALASAQDTPGDLSSAAVGFGFRLGGFFPADNKVRDVKSSFLDVGLEYELEKSLLANGTSYIAGDWISSTFLGGQHIATLSINQRIYTKNERFAAGGSAYFYAGVGAQWLHVAGSTSSTTWLLRGGIGSEFKGNYFLEVGGQFSPKVSGVNGSGISASVGYRFRD